MKSQEKRGVGVFAVYIPLLEMPFEEIMFEQSSK